MREFLVGMLPGGVLGVAVACGVVLVWQPGDLVAELLGGAGAATGMVINAVIYQAIAEREVIDGP